MEDLCIILNTHINAVGTYTVSIEGAKITGTKYQMLGMATDLLAEKYPGVKNSNATITVDGKNVMQSNVNPNPDPLNLIRKSDAAKIPSPSGITIPPAAAKKVGLKVNDTKNLNNHTDNV